MVIKFNNSYLEASGNGYSLPTPKKGITIKFP